MKTNINRPFLKSEDITNQKNFQEVLLRYKTFKKPFYRSAKFYAGMGIAASVIIVVIFKYFSSREEYFVQPPLSQVIIPSHKYIVNADHDTTITYPTGSQISIPAGTFMDKKGNIIAGSVDVQYREFHKAIEFFASGIPMSYDSGGVKYTFQSAGMMEIEAFHDGEQLMMNPEKKISVALASQEPQQEYSLYFLDTIAKQWKFKGDTKLMATRVADSTSLSERDSTIGYSLSDTLATLSPLVTINRQLSRIEASKPLEPRKATDSRYKFTIEVDSAEFPEIAIYQNLLFEVGNENKDFDTSSYAVLWTDAKLKENTRGKNYTLHLSTKQKSVTYIVYPVFKEKDYQAALSAYKTKYAEYQKNLAAKQREQERLQADAKKQIEQATRNQIALENKQARAAEEQRKADTKEQMKRWEATQKYLEQRQAEAEQDLQKQYQQLVAEQARVQNINASITRSFTINGFGVWNCDHPFLFNAPVILAAEFRDQTGKLLNAQQVYLIDKNRNVLVNYSLPAMNMQFDAQSENVLFAVLADERIVTFDSRKFREIDLSKKSYTFNMQVLDEKFTTLKDLRERLGV